ncbi:MAG: FliO/MopB family protein [Planctomycetota bacterium]|jgi:flagellar biogenesis protein FliO
MVATLILALFVSQADQDGPTVPLPPEVRDLPAGTTEPDADRIVPTPPGPAVRKTYNAGDYPGVGTIAFWTVFILILMGALAWFLRRFLNKTRLLGRDVIRVLARKPLTPKQEVFLVEVGPKVFLVGATKERLNYSGASVQGAFRKTLDEGLREAETAPAHTESYDNVVDELKEIRKTVLSWKA